MLARLDRQLLRAGQVLAVVDGNHDDARLREWPRDADGIARLTETVWYLPRGARGVFGSGLTWAALGGAAPVDRTWRQANAKSTWWADEVVSVEDLDRLGDAPADVLFAHDAPNGVPAIDHITESSAPFWDEHDLAYATAGRDLFTRGFLAVQPRLHLGGHFHGHVDQVVGFAGARSAFACRVVVLDQVTGRGPCAAILETETLELTTLAHDGQDRPTPAAPVLDLTTQSSGRWRVLSRDSTHLFDLDARLWVRVPGPDARHDGWRGAFPLRSIETCRIGARGYWTIPVDPGDPLVDYLWHYSSVIRYIEPFEGAWTDATP